MDNDSNLNDDEQAKEDALRPDNGMFVPSRDEPKLAGDNDVPSAPAEDNDLNDPQVPPDYPETDANMDESQVYDEGVTDATEVNAELEEPDNRPHPLDNQE